MKHWFALLDDREDADWGTGSFDFKEAVNMAKWDGYTVIAEIDGGYNENGEAMADAICVREYIAGQDF